MAAFSLLLIAIGAILTFALNVVVDGADLTAIGVILMIVGAVGLIVSLFNNGFHSLKSSSVRQVSDDGRTVVEEHKTNSV